jgi:LacI family transcriptional regulator
MTHSTTPNPKSSSAVRIEQVAARVGVSIATVSRVLNARGKCSEVTRQRVLEAVREMGYAPNTAARSLARGRTQTIGLLVPDVDAEFFAPLLRGVADAAAESGFDLLLALRPAPIGRGAVVERSLGRHNVDGVLVFAGSADEIELRRLRSSGCPVVLLYHAATDGLDVPSVLVENRHGARQAVEHLVRHGRRRIAFLRGPPGYEDAREREQGFRDALEAHGLGASAGPIGNGGFSASVAHATVASWLERGLGFDAIFACDDDSASGALRALHDARVAVPSSVAVIGFDDAPFATHLDPPLTTVRAVTERVGREAVRLLVDQITTGSSALQVRLPTELVVRRSCGCD